MSIDWVCGEAPLLSSVTTVNCADLRSDGDCISNILFSQSFIIVVYNRTSGGHCRPRIQVRFLIELSLHSKKKAA